MSSNACAIALNANVEIYCAQMVSCTNVPTICIVRWRASKRSILRSGAKLNAAGTELIAMQFNPQMLMASQLMTSALYSAFPMTFTVGRAFDVSIAVRAMMVQMSISYCSN